MPTRDPLPEIHRSLRDGWTWKAEYVDLDDKLRFTCNISGYCCIYTEGIPVTAHDVWTILHDKSLKDTIRNDKDLFNAMFQPNKKTGNVKDPPLSLILGNRSKMPLCLTDKRSDTYPFLVPRKKKGFSTRLNVEIDFEELNDYTIDIEWLINRQMPTSSPDFEFLCSLGDSKPTECQSFPLSRFPLAMRKITPEMREFFWRKTTCQSCNPDVFTSGEEMTVREYIRVNNLEERYKLEDLTQDFLITEVAPQWEKNDSPYAVGHALYRPDWVYGDNFKELLELCEIERDAEFPDLQKPDTYLKHLENVRLFFYWVISCLPKAIRVVTHSVTLRELSDKKVE